MHVFRPRVDLARVLLALAPLLGAALIAISRCEDYRHDVWDVTVGSLLGISIAHFTYRRYYPSLKARDCEVPFPSRADMARRDSGFKKIKDDEERVGDAREVEIADLAEDEVQRIPLREGTGAAGEMGARREEE